VTTLFAEAPAGQVVEAAHFDVGGLDADGRARLATAVALELGRAHALKGGLLFPALAPQGEYLLLLVADSSEAEAVLARVERAPLALAPWTEPTLRVEGLFVEALKAGILARPCPDCGSQVGEEHELGCDVERCLVCGAQRLLCDCQAAANEPWAGEWPGVFECRARGWFACRGEHGWQPCVADAAGARADLNRLAFFHAHGYDGLYAIS